METIFAQSSKPGKAGVAVFRISGPDSLKALKKLVKINLGTELSLKPRVMYYKKIFTPDKAEFIDNAMVVYFKAPASFTGQDVVEIHTHGSIVISKLLTKALLSIPNLRLAEPGEFTKIAFLNNKFDLTAAEGLADLLEAETLMQHRQAMQQFSGALEKLYEEWRLKLLNIISFLEAYIDFPDEEIPESIITFSSTTVDELKDSIKLHLNDHRKGELLRNGIKLAIIGPPNVGKSSLLNFLLQREAAIVSDIAGTTRDVIEGHLDIGGYPIIVQDTAGIREKATDIVEEEGIKRSMRSAQMADIKIIMIDDDSIKDAESKFGAFIDDNTIIALNKIDLHKSRSLAPGQFSGKDIIQISIKENKNMDNLLESIQSIAASLTRLDEENPAITRERHRHQLSKALEYLSAFSLDNDLVLAAEDIRMTIRVLSNVTGKITVDEILGEIFSNFCIGK